MFNSNGVKTKMEATVERFKEEMKKVRTGRAHPDMLSSVKAEVYGQFTPLNQISNITVSGGTMLLITPYDVANIAKISSAIRADQSLGLNPSDDGRVIRVPVGLEKLSCFFRIHPVKLTFPESVKTVELYKNAATV